MVQGSTSGEKHCPFSTVFREMILSYIMQPCCIILAITPANLDLANSDALQMDGIVDPDVLKLYGSWICQQLPQNNFSVEGISRAGLLYSLSCTVVPQFVIIEEDPAVPQGFLQKLWMLFKTLIGSFLLEMLLQSSMSFIHMMMSILHYFIGLFWCWIKWSSGLVCASGKEPTQCPRSSGTFHLYFLCIQGLVQCFSCVCSKGDQLIKSNLLNNNNLLKQVSNQD
ncbi:unnamed protein product [Lactuca saligna]|uniref:Uncharacterized protein n=1 Tax=Lactuca saligna TaxID=75948 RepID=A0AA35YQX5_LACSI|nr:unnamed protein product [Lactuca saligna]